MALISLKAGKQLSWHMRLVPLQEQNAWTRDFGGANAARLLHIIHDQRSTACFGAYTPKCDTFSNQAGGRQIWRMKMSTIWLDGPSSQRQAPSVAPT